MFSKRLRPEDHEDPRKRLRSNLSDLFLGGSVTARRFQEVVNDAEAAGAAFVRDIAAPVGSNTSRTIRRALLKPRRHEWPSLYEASVRTWSVQHQTMIMSKISLLLPHEVLASMRERSDYAALLAQGGLAPPSKQHLDQVCASMDVEEACAIGLWADGMPCNSDRTESVEAISWYMPGRRCFLMCPTCFHKDSRGSMLTCAFPSSRSTKSM